MDSSRRYTHRGFTFNTRNCSEANQYAELIKYFLTESGLRLFG